MPVVASESAAGQAAAAERTGIRQPGTSWDIVQWALQNQVAAQVTLDAKKNAEQVLLTHVADAEKKSREAAANHEEAKKSAADPTVVTGLAGAAEAASAQFEAANAAHKQAVKEREEAESALMRWTEVVGEEHNHAAMLERRESSGRKWVQGVISSVVLASLIFVWYTSRGQIQDVEFARGMISLLFGVGTIVIALILTLAAIFQDDVPAEDRFKSGKEILTILIGVFGTIIGFYFGSLNSQGAKSPDEAAILSVGGSVRADTVFLDGTNVSDSDLAHLVGLPNVQRAYLDNTNITKAGLDQLVKLEHLQFLSLTKTKQLKTEDIDAFEKIMKAKSPDFTLIRSSSSPGAGATPKSPGTTVK
jgi:hypothetical protein